MCCQTLRNLPNSWQMSTTCQHSTLTATLTTTSLSLAISISTSLKLAPQSLFFHPTSLYQFSNNTFSKSARPHYAHTNKPHTHTCSFTFLLTCILAGTSTRIYAHYLCENKLIKLNAKQKLIFVFEQLSLNFLFVSTTFSSSSSSFSFPASFPSFDRQTNNF